MRFARAGCIWTRLAEQWSAIPRSGLQVESKHRESKAQRGPDRASSFNHKFDFARIYTSFWRHGPYYAGMNEPDPAFLRTQAKKCRYLADMMFDAELSRLLNGLARDFDVQAKAAEASSPSSDHFTYVATSD